MNGAALRDALRAVIVLAFIAALVTLLMHSAGCATLEGVAEETKTNGEKLSACRAEARLAYYAKDAGLNASLQAYEACKARDGGAP